MPNHPRRTRGSLKPPAPAKRSDGHRGSRTAMTKGPGRPTAARVAQINRAILVAARKEFRAFGYEATRMEQIAAAAGVSKGTLYDRYPTKEALLEAVLADEVAQWSKEGDADGEPVTADLEQRLKHRAHKLIEWCCSEELRQVERLFMSGPPMNELLRMRYEIGHRRTVQVIAQDIVDGTRDQPVQPPVAVRLAEMLVAMIYGWSRAHQEIRVITREELLNDVWHYTSYPTTRTVDNHVMKLRQKLEPDPTRPVYFRTMHGIGYKFVRGD